MSEVVERKVVLDFIAALGLDPKSVNRLVIAPTVITAERVLYIGAERVEERIEIEDENV